MKLPVLCPGPGGFDSGLWWLNPAQFGRWLSWKMHPSQSPRLYARTLVGGAYRDRDYFQPWLDGTSWLIVLHEPRPAEGMSEFVYRWLCRAWEDGQQVVGIKPDGGRMISIDVGLVGLDDLDLSLYVEGAVARPD